VKTISITKIQTSSVTCLTTSRYAYMYSQMLKNVIFNT